MRRTLLICVSAAAVLAACGGGESVSTTSTSTTTDVPAADSAPAPTEPAATEAPVAPAATAASTTSTTLPAVDRVDWANHTYAAECGTASELTLVDGVFRPDDQNSVDQVLEVELQGVDPLVPRLDDVLVHLSCRAGGVGAELSSELFVVVRAADEPRQDLVVTAEPTATHTINADGIVVIDDVTYGADDPSCCPSVNRSRQIRWVGDTPVVVEGGVPDAPPDGERPAGGCVGTELALGATDATSVDVLEQALAAAGFDPGPIDGRLDELTVAAVVRVIEFNADNPAMRAEPGAPYSNLHAEAAQHGRVRAPVLRVLGIACDVVTSLEA